MVDPTACQAQTYRNYWIANGAALWFGVSFHPSKWATCWKGRILAVRKVTYLPWTAASAFLRLRSGQYENEILFASSAVKPRTQAEVM